MGNCPYNPQNNPNWCNLIYGFCQFQKSDWKNACPIRNCYPTPAPGDQPEPGPKPEPLPYDHEVEYIQLDCATAAMNAGVSFGCENEFLGLNITNAHVRIEAVCSAYGSGKVHVGIFGIRGIAGANARIRSRSTTTPTEATITGGVNADDALLLCSSIDDYRTCATTVDVGTIRFFVDGVQFGADYVFGATVTGNNCLYRYSNGTNNTVPQENTWIALWPSTSATTTKVCRCKGVKCWKGDTLVIDGVPCVKGDAMGWYNKVDGSLHVVSTTVQPGYSAGPVVY